MAFLGDFGKIFLGGATTGAVGQAIGGFFGAPQGGRLVGQGVADFASRAGDTLDISAPSAGVDSKATVAPVSQTGRIGVPPGPLVGGFSPVSPPRQEAFIGGLAPLVQQGVQQATRLLTRPGVGSAIGGFGAGAVVDTFVDAFGNQKKLVITRKMQRDIKKLFMLSGGDFNMTADLYRMATGRNISGEQVVQIITKTFKNQGPFVTKAAVRKPRQTIRKMETLCDLKDRLAPPKRRAPARRRTMSTSITQVK